MRFLRFRTSHLGCVVRGKEGSQRNAREERKREKNENLRLGSVGDLEETSNVGTDDDCKL